MDLDQLRSLKPAASDRAIVGQAAQDGDGWFLDSHDTYGWYFAVGQAVAPAAILELGVRYGYGLIAMAKGAIRAARRPELVGIDGEKDGIASNEIAYASIHQMLGRELTGLKILRWDTAALPSGWLYFAERFGLIHVDADHSVEGVRRELELACVGLTPRGCILIDDCDTPLVKAAGLDLCTKLGIQPLELPTLHRTMLLDFGQRR